MGREELLDLPKLTKDDTFVFGCNQCGKCCRERHDLILNCLDLYKIAKYLNKSMQGVISEYCEHYLGSESHIPIVKIKPTNYKNSCPFLKGKCSIHSVKPAVCALYPLGRMLNGQTGEMSYIIQRYCNYRDKIRNRRYRLIRYRGANGHIKRRYET